MDKSELSDVLLQFLPQKRQKGKYYLILARGRTDYKTLTEQKFHFLKAIPVTNNYRLFLLDNGAKSLLSNLPDSLGIEVLRVFDGTFLKICDHIAERSEKIVGIDIRKNDGSKMNVNYSDGTFIELDQIHKYHSEGYKFNSITVSNGEAKMRLDKDFMLDAEGNVQESTKLVSEIVMEALFYSMEAFERIEKCVLKPGKFMVDRPNPVKFHMEQNSARDLWKSILHDRIVTWRGIFNNNTEAIIVRDTEGNRLVRMYLDDNQISILPMASTTIGFLGEIAEDIEESGGIFIA
ncbi:MAG: hypothetical protein ACYDAO_09815 [Thermoplasmataceae archaeon]